MYIIHAFLNISYLINYITKDSNIEAPSLDLWSGKVLLISTGNGEPDQLILAIPDLSSLSFPVWDTIVKLRHYLTLLYTRSRFPSLHKMMPGEETATMIIQAIRREDQVYFLPASLYYFYRFST